MSALIGIICFILVITLAVLAVAFLRRPAARRAAGGAAHAQGAAPHAHAQGDAHALGNALHAHARAATGRVARGEEPYFTHALGQYRGGDARGAARGDARVRPWTEFTTWTDLYNNKESLDAYLIARASAIDNPNIDWTNVMKEIKPLLEEKIEYIGLINLEADGRTAKLVQYESSPAPAPAPDEINFASITSELVDKYARRPALFIFHTHPSDEQASPLPSSHDLVTAAHMSALTRFAANIIISSYGVLMFGLDWEGYHAIHEAKNWDAALTDLAFDIASAHEARRSWVAHTLRNYLDFYPMHQMFMTPFPSSLMASNGRSHTYYWNVGSSIDHGLLDDLYSDAEAAKKAPPVHN